MIKKGGVFKNSLLDQTLPLVKFFIKSLVKVKPTINVSLFPFLGSFGIKFITIGYLPVL
jgi:hypothetical protein